MEPTNENESVPPVDAAIVATPKAVEASPEVRPSRGGGALRSRGQRSGRGGGRGGGGRGGRTPRERSEFDQVTIDARRVARVMAGGRRFNFSIVVVLGDRKGRVGVGLGKGADTALAVDKATRDAKKHMITIPRTSNNSIPHDVRAKYSASVVELIPSKGRGLVAGSAVRTVLDFGGVTDVISKIHSRTKNKLTIARATVAALKELRTK
ncbi:MAG: 30S ribosomal protein S5 [bacterium]|nr:30S ribosomal protein S5 [bacterium]